MPHDSRNDTPEEYAAYTGRMSYPVGVAKAAIDAQESVACEAADADYVNAFMHALADPDMRIVSEKTNEWTNWGAKAKAAILAALKRAKEKA